MTEIITITAPPPKKKRRPKDIGTWGETATLKVLLPFFPDAERKVQHGHRDVGDIGNCGQFIFEVKAGKQTLQFGDKQLASWMSEARREAAHAGVPYGILVVQRHGFGAPSAGRWWAWCDLSELVHFAGGHYIPIDPAPVRLELADLLSLLGDNGFTPDAPEQ